MANAHLAVAVPTARNVTVRPRQPRDYLTPREIERLIEAARGNRWGHRDATAILMAYRHEGARTVHIFVSERVAPLSVPDSAGDRQSGQAAGFRF